MEEIYKESLKNFKNRAFTSKKQFLFCFISRNHTYMRWLLYKNYVKMNEFKGLLKYIYVYKYQKISSKINVMINTYSFISNLWFEHYNIVINKKSVIGNNVVLIGNNCIGGNDVGAPIIGDNVFIGYGATIIGNVRIANGVKIGANAIVTKDVLIENATVVGINQIIKKW